MIPFGMAISIWIIVIQLPWNIWTRYLVVIDAAAFVGGVWFAAVIGGQELAQQSFLAAIILTALLRLSRWGYRLRHR